MINKYIYFAAALIAVSLTGCSGASENDLREDQTDISLTEYVQTVKTDGEPQSFSIFAMDTYMTVTVYDGDTVNAVSQAKAEIERLEKMWSVTDENSEIYRLDHSGGNAEEVSTETAELIEYADDMNIKTDGALNISMYPLLSEWGFTNGNYKIPDGDRITELLEHTDCRKIIVDSDTVTLPAGMSIDLGAVGKGETGDRVTQILKQNGVTSALLDLGGNIQTVGSKTDGSDWKIGLKSPFGDDNIAKLQISDSCVITSGGYERYFIGDDGEIYWHILDPKTGKPARSGLISATVIGDKGRMCDALSTSLFVMGEKKAAELWRSMGGFEMILITDDNRMIITEGLKDSLTVYDQYSYISTEILLRS